MIIEANEEDIRKARQHMIAKPPEDSFSKVIINYLIARGRRPLAGKKDPCIHLAFDDFMAYIQNESALESRHLQPAWTTFTQSILVKFHLYLNSVAIREGSSPAEILTLKLTRFGDGKSQVFVATLLPPNIRRPRLPYDASRFESTEADVPPIQASRSFNTRTVAELLSRNKGPFAMSLEDILVSIAYIDGSTDVGNIPAVSSADMNPPSAATIRSARQKLNAEPHSFIFLDSFDRLVGYASVWRTMKGDGEQVLWAAREHDWNVPEGAGVFGNIPGVYEGIVSSLRILPHCREQLRPNRVLGLSTALDRFSPARIRLVQAVSELLMAYAQAGQYFEHLYIVATHKDEQDFFQDRNVFGKCIRELDHERGRMCFRLTLLPWALPDNRLWGDLANLYAVAPEP